MQIYPNALRCALLAMLRREFGDTMAVRIRDVRHAWPRTGFRRSDLPGALAVLIRENLANVSQRPGAAWLELTEGGLEECRRLGVDGTQSFADWLVLRRIKRRQRSATATSHPRRERRRG
jgi:hypothetical protein